MEPKDVALGLEALEIRHQGETRRRVLLKETLSGECLFDLASNGAEHWRFESGNVPLTRWLTSEEALQVHFRDLVPRGARCTAIAYACALLLEERHGEAVTTLGWKGSTHVDAIYRAGALESVSIVMLGLASTAGMTFKVETPEQARLSITRPRDSRVGTPEELAPLLCDWMMFQEKYLK